MIAVGVTESIRIRELAAIASYDNFEGKNVLLAKKFDDLDDIKDELIDAICNSKWR